MCEAKAAVSPIAAPGGGEAVPVTPASPACGGALRVVQALSRIQQLHAAKQREAEEVMEAFGDAVSTAAPEQEQRRLSCKLEALQTEVSRLEELQVSVEEKQVEADEAMLKFGAAVEANASSEEQARLSMEADAARAAVEREESQKIDQFQSETAVARKLERMRLKAEKAEQAARDAAAKKPVYRRPSADKTTPKPDAGRRPSLQAQRRASSEKAKPTARPSLDNKGSASGSAVDKVRRMSGGDKSSSSSDKRPAVVHPRRTSSQEKK